MADPDGFPNFEMEDPNQASAKKKGDVYSCYKCTKTFTSWTNVEKHVTFCNNGDFICPDCGIKFVNITSAVKHYEIHKGTEKWECDRCGKSLFKGNDKTSHLRSHEREFHYKCKTCDSAFRDYYSRMVHEAKNHNVPRFECGHCGKWFINSVQITKHTKWEHGKTLAKPMRRVPTSEMTSHSNHSTPRNTNLVSPSMISLHSNVPTMHAPEHPYLLQYSSETNPLVFNNQQGEMTTSAGQVAGIYPSFPNDAKANWLAQNAHFEKHMAQDEENLKKLKKVFPPATAPPLLPPTMIANHGDSFQRLFDTWEEEEAEESETASEIITL